MTNSNAAATPASSDVLTEPKPYRVASDQELRMAVAECDRLGTSMYYAGDALKGLCLELLERRAPVSPSASSDEDTGTTAETVKVLERATALLKDQAMSYEDRVRNDAYPNSPRMRKNRARANEYGEAASALHNLTDMVRIAGGIPVAPAVDAGTTDARSCTHCDGDGYVPARHPTEDGERFDDCPVCNGSGERVTDDEILKLRARAGDVEPLEYELAELRASLESRSPAVDDETVKPEATDSERLDWLDARGFSLTPMFDPSARWAMEDETLAMVDARPTRYYGMTIREAIDAARKDGAA